MNRILSSAVVILAVSLAACGGGASDEDKIRDVVKEAVTGKDPAGCETLFTDKFVEEFQGSVKACRDRRKDAAADRVSVNSVRLAGGKASAKIVARDGGEDIPLVLRLVKEDDSWKISGAESDERSENTSALEEDSPEAAVDTFMKALFEGDTATACGLLAAEGLEEYQEMGYAEKGSCEQALATTSEKLLGGSLFTPEQYLTGVYDVVENQGGAAKLKLCLEKDCGLWQPVELAQAGTGWEITGPPHP